MTAGRARMQSVNLQSSEGWSWPLGTAQRACEVVERVWDGVQSPDRAVQASQGKADRQKPACSVWDVPLEPRGNHRAASAQTGCDSASGRLMGAGNIVPSDFLWGAVRAERRMASREGIQCLWDFAFLFLLRSLLWWRRVLVKLHCLVLFVGENLFFSYCS